MTITRCCGLHGSGNQRARIGVSTFATSAAGRPGRGVVTWKSDPWTPHHHHQQMIWPKVRGIKEARMSDRRERNQCGLQTKHSDGVGEVIHSTDSPLRSLPQENFQNLGSYSWMWVNTSCEAIIGRWYKGRMVEDTVRAKSLQTWGALFQCWELVWLTAHWCFLSRNCPHPPEAAWPDLWPLLDATCSQGLVSAGSKCLASTGSHRKSYSTSKTPARITWDLFHIYIKHLRFIIHLLLKRNWIELYNSRYGIVLNSKLNSKLNWKFNLI